MKYNKLADFEVSQIALGCMNFGSRNDLPTSHAILDKAYDLGINLIDTSDGYGKSEEIIGEWIQQSGNRDDMVISTKVGWPNQNGDRGLSQQHINNQIQVSLNKLNTDRVDIYQPHDDHGNLPVESIVETFTDLKEKGKVEHYGLPIFTKPVRLEEWIKTIDNKEFTRPILGQMVFSLYSRGMHLGDRYPSLVENNYNILTFAPLGGGLVTGKYHSAKSFPHDGKEMFRKTHEEGKSDKIVEALQEVAQQYDVSTALVAMNWVFSHDFMSSVIVGASHPDQLEEITKAVKLNIDNNDLEYLTKISDTHHIW